MKKYKIIYLKDGFENSEVLELDTIDKSKLPQNIISIKEVNFSFDFKLKKRIKEKDLNFLFYELDLMLQSNISFNDALDILIKNKKDKNIVELLTIIKNAFSCSSSIEKMLDGFKINPLVISFLKICQESGNIKLNIQALSKLLDENYQVKKMFFKSISYPIVLITTFIFSLFSIFYFVIPQFKLILSQFYEHLPLSTKILLFIENSVNNYLFFIISIPTFFICMIIYFIKTNKKINFMVHKFLIKKAFFIKDIYLNIELYRLFFVLSILLESKYEFHKALEYSKVLLKNKYVLAKINFIENLLYNGNKVKDSFEKVSLFDDIILNLINTGEVSNALPLTLKEIRKIYKDRFYDKVNKLTNLMQPIFLILVMAMILWLILAIFIPIWDMGNLIKI